MDSLRLKIVLIGESGVGKSSILLRYCHRSDRDGPFRFSDRPVSTIGCDFRTQVLSVNRRTVLAEVWDTAGQERFRTITSSFFRGAHIVMIVYDVSDRRSFVRLTNWIAEARRFAPPAAVRAVVGNKADLSRAVSEKEARGAFANRSAVWCGEISAKNGKGVEEAFRIAATAALKNGGGAEAFEIGGDKEGSSACC